MQALFAGLDAQQLACAQAPFSSPLAIIAGPGAGKTRTLVARCCSAVRSGAALAQNVCVVSFTRAAVEELRARLSGLLGAQAVGRDGVTVSTFHGLALQCVKRFYSDLKCPPGARRAWGAKAPPSLITHREPLEIAMNVSYDRCASQTRELAAALKRGDQTVALKVFGERGKETCVLILDEAKATFCVARLFRDGSVKRLAEDDAITQPFLPEPVRKGKGDAKVPKASKASPTERWFSEKVRGLRSEARVFLSAWDKVRLLGRSESDCDAAGCSDLANFGRAFTAACSDANECDFNDIMRLAIELLRPGGSARARRAFGALTCVLVDEVQDCSAPQLALLHEILAAGVERRKSEYAHSSSAAGPVLPQLTVVGDPRQSIFAFNGAVRNVFSQLQTTFPALRILSLTTNYRSVRDVVFAANCIGAGMPSVGVEIKPSEVPAGSGIAVAGQDAASSAVTIVEARTVECELSFVLAAIESLLLQQPPAGARRIALGDIAILCRLRETTLQVLNVLRKLGVPCTLSSSSTLAARPVRVALAVLRLVCNDAADADCEVLIKASTKSRPPLSPAAYAAISSLESGADAAEVFDSAAAASGAGAPAAVGASAGRSRLSALRLLVEHGAQAAEAPRKRKRRQLSGAASDEDVEEDSARISREDVKLARKIVGTIDNLRANLSVLAFESFVERCSVFASLGSAPPDPMRMLEGPKSTVPIDIGPGSSAVSPAWRERIARAAAASKDASKSGAGLSQSSTMKNFVAEWARDNRQRFAPPSGASAQPTPASKAPPRFSYSGYDDDEIEDADAAFEAGSGASSSTSAYGSEAYTARRRMIAAFAEALEARISEPTALDDEKRDEIYVGTIHSAKGREWEAVFNVRADNMKEPLNGVAEETDDDEEGEGTLSGGGLTAMSALCPGKSALHDEMRAMEISLDEERRLFFVAASRARRHLCLSWAQV